MSYAGSTHNNTSNYTEFMILVTPHRLRSRVGQARSIFVGRGDPQNRGSIGAGAPPEPEPITPQPQPEPATGSAAAATTAATAAAAATDADAAASVSTVTTGMRALRLARASQRMPGEPL